MNMAVKILSGTLKQASYYVLPKNVALVLTLLAGYVNGINQMQTISVFGALMQIVYVFVSVILFSVACIVLCKHHRKLAYTHHVRVFNVDVNELMESFFQKYLPYVVNRFSLLWLVLLSCTAIGSTLVTFYTPKLNLNAKIDEYKFDYEPSKHPVDAYEREANVFTAFAYSTSRKGGVGDVDGDVNGRFDTERNLSLWIVWGMRVERNRAWMTAAVNSDDKSMDTLFDKNMETKPYQQHTLMRNLCLSLYGPDRDQINKQYILQPNSYVISDVNMNMRLLSAVECFALSLSLAGDYAASG
jgi:hypothetical protein